MSNLKAIKRVKTSSSSNSKLRAEGLITAILYGGKDPNQNISIEKKWIKNIVNSFSKNDKKSLYKLDFVKKYLRNSTFDK